jgi:hypothetical protein
MTQRDVEFRIDELILRGVPPVDGLEVSGAVEREIARLLAVHGLPGIGEGVCPSTRGEPIDSTSSLSAEEMGQQLGQSIYGGLHRE